MPLGELQQFLEPPDQQVRGATPDARCGRDRFGSNLQPAVRLGGKGQVARVLDFPRHGGQVLQGQVRVVVGHGIQHVRRGDEHGAQHHPTARQGHRFPTRVGKAAVLVLLAAAARAGVVAAGAGAGGPHRPVMSHGEPPEVPAVHLVPEGLLDLQSTVRFVDQSLEDQVDGSVARDTKLQQVVQSLGRFRRFALDQLVLHCLMQQNVKPWVRPVDQKFLRKVVCVVEDQVQRRMIQYGEDLGLFLPVHLHPVPGQFPYVGRVSRRPLG